MSRYTEAKEVYAAYGVNTDKALRALSEVTISVHCWQGDDVVGFDYEAVTLGRHSDDGKLSR